MTRSIALLLTAITGFAGLAYEVAWQRYLATLLGAHSEATAAVLAIFLGGLSVGYWLFGALTRALVARASGGGRAPPLLLCYGAVEAAIGVYALLFPWLFRGAQQISLWLPIGGGLGSFAADVALCAALIGPPSVLMGGTIPILTQALARSLADATRLHALVYATNTAGAFAGALVAGFVLVPWLGLDGIARAMGVINLGAGAVFALLGLRPGAVVPLGDPDTRPARAVARGTATYAATALLVGFGGMTSQAILIRIGGLTLGSSEFTFAMVVAAFVLSIAVGSLVVSALPRVWRSSLPVALWLIVFVFVLLYTHVDEAPYWGHVLRTFFASREETFYAYYAAAFLATLCAIGPAVALAGAALPLIFDAVREEIGDLGEKAGRLYSQNTIGSLLGALIGGYALMFWLDLHYVFRIGLAAFALAASLVTAQRYLGGRRLAGTAALFAPVAIALAALPAWDPSRLSSGWFRLRDPQPWTYLGPNATEKRAIVFHDDDPTSTVIAVRAQDDSASIVVNGKPDGNTTADLHTMALAALVPTLIADRPETAFVIGFGTGITAGYLADLDSMRSVTVAEISSGVLGAAPHFDPYNNGASRHPKIELVRSDAYRALMRRSDRFDVIVSEPSNPWAAGIEMLFSREFLSAARDRLAPGGVYVQWYHLYENNDRAVELVLRTYADVFDQVAVWGSQSTDLLLIGMRDDVEQVDLARLEQRAAQPDVRRALARLGIVDVSQVLLHELLPLGVLNAGVPSGLPVHTLYHPRLSYEAGRGFFAGGQAHLPFMGGGLAGAIGMRNSLLRRYLAEQFAGHPPDEVWDRLIARACSLSLPQCPTLVAAWARDKPREQVAARIADLSEHSRPAARLDLVPLLRFFLGDPSEDLPAGPPAEMMRDAAAFRNRYYHALPFPARSLVDLWHRCAEGGVFGPGCQQGLRIAKQYSSTAGDQQPVALE